MTAPVTTDDLVQGAQIYLAGMADVTAVLGRFVATGSPYLFQHRLFVAIENTQSNACVLGRPTSGGGWAVPNQHNTMRFPRLLVDLYCDPLRDDGNNITDPGEVIRRAEAIYRIIDRHLHRPQGGTQLWGTVRTVGCTRLGDPSLTPVPDGNGLVQLSVQYGVTEG